MGSKSVMCIILANTPFTLQTWSRSSLKSIKDCVGWVNPNYPEWLDRDQVGNKCEHQHIFSTQSTPSLIELRTWSWLTHVVWMGYKSRRANPLPDIRSIAIPMCITLITDIIGTFGTNFCLRLLTWWLCKFATTKLPSPAVNCLIRGRQVHYQPGKSSMRRVVLSDRAGESSTPSERTDWRIFRWQIFLPSAEIETMANTELTRPPPDVNNDPGGTLQSAPPAREDDERQLNDLQTG